jgi:hypothetical protein
MDGMQVPPRPDLNGPAPSPSDWSSWAPPPVRRRSSRRFVAIVVALAVGAASFAGAAALIGGVVRPSGDSSEHRFLGFGVDGDPLRWNPCQPIHYVVNTGNAPPGSIEDVHEAVRRISAITGIAFEFDGTSREIPTRARVAAEPGDGTYAPVLVAWVDPDETDISFRPQGHVAAGVARPLGPLDETTDAIVSGWIAINQDDPNPPGFDDAGDQGPVILHEWGHIMGLDHVDEQGELMEPSGGWMTDFGPGDRAGLEELGRRGGCLDIPAP